MVICPVCEHTQASGEECEQCGKVLAAVAPAGRAAVAVQRLADLEVNAQPAGPAAAVSRLGELEDTLHATAPDLPVLRIAEVEPNAAPSTGPVVVQPLAELDTGRAPADKARTAVDPFQVTCRYCRNVQAVGAICDRCGMRLPRTGDAVAAPVRSSGVTVWTRCRQCGAPAKGGERCGDCGRDVAMPES